MAFIAIYKRFLTEDDFNELYDFVEEIKFDRLGVFTFSKEEDTESFDMTPSVPQEIMYERYNKIMELQSSIIEDKNKKLIGRKYDVIIDDFDFDTQFYIARSYAYAPDDVDGCIYVSSPVPLIIGEIYQVEIIEAKTYDLVGCVIEK